MGTHLYSLKSNLQKNPSKLHPKMATPNQESGITMYNGLNMRKNAMAVESCRTAVTCLGGITAGTLGLTSISGFIFFFFVTAVLGLTLILRAGTNWKNHFVSRSNFFTDNFFGSLFLYVVFWTFFYGLVNVY